VNFYNSGDSGEDSLSGGLAAIISGVLTLSVFFWAGPSHTYMGVNWVDLFGGLILSIGCLLTIGGLGLLAHWLSLAISVEEDIAVPTSG
jgi:hypothetical protein